MEFSAARGRGVPHTTTRTSPPRAHPLASSVGALSASRISMRKLFGTDGIRAVAGEAPLDKGTIYAIGVALATKLAEAHQPVRIVLGMDTRESCHWIAATLTAGLRAAGAEVASAGVLTTPAIAFLAHTHGFSAGVVISASHNPWQDNGIKIFGHDGYKLPDETELAIEDEIFRLRPALSFSPKIRQKGCRCAPAIVTIMRRSFVR